MTDQERRRWKAMVSLAAKARAAGQATVSLDVDLLLVVHEFLTAVVADLLREREGHACPS